MTPHYLIRISAVVTFVFASIALAESPDVAAALADRAKNVPQSQWHTTYYLSMGRYRGPQRTDLERSIKFLVASASMQPVLEMCVPVHVSERLLRLDVGDLGWDPKDWHKVQTLDNPYTHDATQPLVIDAAYLLSRLGDVRESDAYMRLPFGGSNMPKSKDDVLKRFNVGSDPLLTYGMIEGKSGVSVSGTRRLDSLPALRGNWCYVTSDYFKIDSKHDPIENPDGNAKPDGQEGILKQHKQSLTTGEHCVLPYFWLNNGDGTIVKEAPCTLVSANPPFRGANAIVTPGACIQCHKEGFRPPNYDAFRAIIQSGVNLYRDRDSQRKLEAQLLSDVDGEIKLANTFYARAVRLVCDCEPAELSTSFKNAIDAYDAPLDLLETARELGVKEAVWTKTLATSSPLPGRLASLVHGGTIPRVAWEEYYLAAYDAVQTNGPINFNPKAVPIPAEKPRETSTAKATPKVTPQPAPRPPQQQQPNNRRFR